jgi:DNA repair exonuclease SbcCD ATPase subunit
VGVGQRQSVLGEDLLDWPTVASMNKLRISSQKKLLMNSEKKEEVERLDQEAKTLDSEFVSQQRRLRQLRTDWRAIQASKSEVETAKDRALQEADDLRDKLQAQQPNSGNIVVYEEAIAVSPCRNSNLWQDAQEEKKVLLGQVAAIIEEQKKLLEERKPLSQKAREMSNAIKKLNDDIANAEVKYPTILTNL